MIKSLRWRMQLWFTGLLLIVVALFAGFLYHQAWSGKLRETDAQLESAALYLDAVLRGYPPFEVEGKPPPKPKGPPGFPPKPKDRHFADLKLPRELESLPGGEKQDETYFCVWRPDGTILRQKGPSAIATFNPPVKLSLHPNLRFRGDDREAWLHGAHRTSILVGRPFGRERAALRTFAFQLIGAGAAVVALGSLLVFFFSARLVKPLAAMSKAAGSISEVNLGERLETVGMDFELASLGGVLNATFARLEAAFERQAQFTADASHELRTPLAIIRSQAELALSRPRSEEEYRRALDSVLRAASRMGNLVQGLLTLARSDGKSTSIHRSLIQLDMLVGEALDMMLPLAKEKKIEVTAELATCSVFGDAAGLSQVVANLIHNAIQYTPTEGRVRVSLQVAGHVELTVTDEGIGIPLADQPFIFERFYRVDKARTRAAGGAGLGLAICKTIVTAHGGDIDFVSVEGKGSTFRVRLPSAAVAVDKKTEEGKRGDSR